LPDATTVRRLAAARPDEPGTEPRIIDGETEGSLIYSAVRASVLMEKGPVLAFDLGGGSLEVMVGDGCALWWARSLPLGVARLTTELVRNDPLSRGDQRRLRKRIVDHLEPVAGRRHAAGQRHGALRLRRADRLGVGAAGRDGARRHPDAAARRRHPARRRRHPPGVGGGAGPAVQLGRGPRPPGGPPGAPDLRPGPADAPPGPPRPG